MLYSCSSYSPILCIARIVCSGSATAAIADMRGSLSSATSTTDDMSNSITSLSSGVPPSTSSSGAIDDLSPMQPVTSIIAVAVTEPSPVVAASASNASSALAAASAPTPSPSFDPLYKPEAQTTWPIAGRDSHDLNSSPWHSPYASSFRPMATASSTSAAATGTGHRTWRLHAEAGDPLATPSYLLSSGGGWRPEPPLQQRVSPFISGDHLVSAAADAGIDAFDSPLTAPSPSSWCWWQHPHNGSGAAESASSPLWNAGAPVDAFSLDEKNENPLWPLAGCELTTTATAGSASANATRRGDTADDQWLHDHWLDEDMNQSAHALLRDLFGAQPPSRAAVAAPAPQTAALLSAEPFSTDPLTIARSAAASVLASISQDSLTASSDSHTLDSFDPAAFDPAIQALGSIITTPSATTSSTSISSLSENLEQQQPPQPPPPPPSPPQKPPLPLHPQQQIPPRLQRRQAATKSQSKRRSTVSKESRHPHPPKGAGTGASVKSSSLNENRSQAAAKQMTNSEIDEDNELQVRAADGEHESSGSGVLLVEILEKLLNGMQSTYRPRSNSAAGGCECVLQPDAAAAVPAFIEEDIEAFAERTAPPGLESRSRKSSQTQQVNSPSKLAPRYSSRRHEQTAPPPRLQAKRASLTGATAAESAFETAGQQLSGAPPKPLLASPTLCSLPGTHTAADAHACTHVAASASPLLVQNQSATSAAVALLAQLRELGLTASSSPTSSVQWATPANANALPTQTVASPAGLLPSLHSNSQLSGARLVGPLALSPLVSISPNPLLMQTLLAAQLAPAGIGGGPLRRQSSGSSPALTATLAHLLRQPATQQQLQSPALTSALATVLAANPSIVNLNSASLIAAVGSLAPSPPAPAPAAAVTLSGAAAAAAATAFPTQSTLHQLMPASTPQVLNQTQTLVKPVPTPAHVESSALPVATAVAVQVPGQVSGAPVPTSTSLSSAAVQQLQSRVLPWLKSTSAPISSSSALPISIHQQRPVAAALHAEAPPFFPRGQAAPATATPDNLESDHAASASSSSLAASPAASFRSPLSDSESGTAPTPLHATGGRAKAAKSHNRHH